jgi:uncharacterized membrane-anchored protein YhcB (DUF1043 family)
MQTVPFIYSLAAGVIALLVGMFLGAVLRGVKARRQVDRLSLELQRVRQELTQATGMAQAAVRTTAPARWTGAEVAAVIGAIGTLCASFGTLATVYVNYQAKALENSRADLTTAAKVVRYPLAEWTGLNHSTLAVNGQTRPQEIGLDHKDYSGDCGSKKITLSYLGSGPAMLHCAQGAVTIKLYEASTLLFVSEKQDPFVIK